MRRITIVCLALLASGCGSSLTESASCAGVTLSTPAAVTIRANAPEATSLYDTVTVDASIAVSPDDSAEPVHMTAVTGKATALPSLVRVYNHALPANVIPVILFVTGKTPGVDTVVIRSTIHGPGCANGAVAKVAVTVTP